MPFKIALTGGIGSGKSIITEIFSSLGINIIDTDVIAREVVKINSPALKIITKRYGNTILTEQGILYRSQMRNIIFEDIKERKWLNQLLLPLINIRIKQLNQLATSPYIIWVVPLLVENKMQYLVDRVLMVDTEENIQILRTKNRDNISINDVKKILLAQATREERTSYANDIIENNGTKQELLSRIIKLHQNYLRIAKTK